MFFIICRHQLLVTVSVGILNDAEQRSVGSLANILRLQAVETSGTAGMLVGIGLVIVQ